MSAAPSSITCASSQARPRASRSASQFAPMTCCRRSKPSSRPRQNRFLPAAVQNRRREPPFCWAYFGFGAHRLYNSVMRALAVFALLASCGAAAQGPPDAFEITQRFAASGALQTALTRIAQLEPATAAAPRWGDWEQLRCELMYRLSRHQELAQRVAALPASVAEKTARTCLLQGARAAVAVAQGATARDFLARLIWRQEPAADELRQARLLVIESYLAERKPRDAYALMLRYQQDFKPVDRDTAARFVEALLAAGMEKKK